MCPVPDRLLPPAWRRAVPHARALNILLRTVHLAAMGMLLGAHAFDVSEERLHGVLYLTIASGGGLVFLEAWPGLHWFHQGRGLFVLLKLALLCVVPLWWSFRLPILLVVVVLASVGSHMPRRFRYYSVVYRRVLDPSQ